eukprot:snap_masked-scaffold_3-processed-gene-7.1-mRNA-1 protein AED:1.00 eAED:1.00 QI:0/-1/0/0/-1/1/1/0/328
MFAKKQILMVSIAQPIVALVFHYFTYVFQSHRFYFFAKYTLINLFPDDNSLVLITVLPALIPALAILALLYLTKTFNNPDKTSKDQSIALLLVTLPSLLVLIVSVAIFTLVSNYTDSLSTTLERTQSSSDLSDYTLAAYSVCCEDFLNQDSLSPEPCPLTEDSEIGSSCFQSTVDYSFYKQLFPSNICEYFEETKLDISQAEVPGTRIALRTLLQGRDEIYIVGDANLGGCGGGLPLVFQYEFVVWGEQSVRLISVFGIVVGAAGLLSMAVVVWCYADQTPVDVEKPKTQERKRVGERTQIQHFLNSVKPKKSEEIDLLSPDGVDKHL